MDTYRDAKERHIKAKLYINIEEFEKGNIAFTRAIRSVSDCESFYSSYGKALFDQKRYKEASPKFAIATKIFPFYVNAYIDWGNTVFLEGNVEKAIKIFEKIIEIVPRDSYAYNNLGFILYSQEKFEEALDGFKKAIHFNPRFNVAYFNWCLTLFHQNNILEALQIYKRGIKASAHGIFSVKQLIEIYNIQIYSAEEQLSKLPKGTGNNFLELKLAGMKQIVGLLACGSMQKPKISTLPDLDHIKDPFVKVFYNKEIAKTEQDMILSDPILTEYNLYLHQEIFLIFSKIFNTVDSSVNVPKEETLQGILRLLLEAFKTPHKILSIEKIFPSIYQAARDKSLNWGEFYKNEVFKKWEALSNRFCNLDEMDLFAKILSQKLTILRKERLAVDYHKKISPSTFIHINKIKGALDINPISSKSEELALLDCIVLVLLCLLGGVVEQTWLNAEQNIIFSAEEIKVKFEIYLKAVEKEKKDRLENFTLM